MKAIAKPAKIISADPLSAAAKGVNEVYPRCNSQVEAIGNFPPAEAEERYYAQLADQVQAA